MIGKLPIFSYFGLKFFDAETLTKVGEKSFFDAVNKYVNLVT